MVRLVKVIAGVAALAAVVLALAAWWRANAATAPEYRLASARVIDIVSTISATGTVVPEEVIDVGAQVNGQIASFGKDTDGKEVDYRSSVEEGIVLARIDDALFRADLATAQAQLGQAKALVEVATANRDQARAKLDQAARDWERAQRLGASEALAQADYDALHSAYDQAVASVAVNEATIAQQQASVQMAQASVDRAQRNLTYCTIKSPVSGVVIDRRVEIGQTVVASLNAPSLFLLARDLSRMQVLVQVNEADIGNVHPGQEVSFATDAFGNETFHGAVRKVRLNATMTQNVVTYTVEIDTDNADLKLLPYLTANVKFMVQRHDNVLAVPNAALRWSPAPAPGSRTSRGPAPPTSNGATASRAAAASRPAARESASTVWVLDSGQPRAVRVRVGITDGTMTEVQSSELSEGSQVIVGQEVAAGAGARSSGGPAGSTGETNPFTPQLPRGRGPR